MRLKTLLRWTAGIALLPFALSALAICLLYLPPIQKWAVNTAGESLGESLGMKVRVEEVRIAPFMDLLVKGVVATDTTGDTLLSVEKLTLDVAFTPLLEGRADINGFLLDQTRINSKTLIPDCLVKGSIRHLSADARGIDWVQEKAHINRAVLRDADLLIVLADTAAKDTTETPVNWMVDVDKASIRQLRLHLSLPADSTGTAFTTQALLGSAEMERGHFDLGEPFYGFQKMKVLESNARLGQMTLPPRLDETTMADIQRIGLIIDTLSYNGAGELRCGVKHLAFDEQEYGLHIEDISGSVYLDTTRFEVPALNFHTACSRLNASIGMDWASLQAGDYGKMNILLDAAIGRQDLRAWLGTAVLKRYIDASLLKGEYVRPFVNSDINFSARLHGNLSHLTIDHYALALPRILSIQGNLDVAEDFNRYQGRANANLYGGLLSTRFDARLKQEAYDVTASIRNFPVGKFVKGVNTTPLTADFKAKGHGFDITARRSVATLLANIQKFEIADYIMDGLHLEAAAKDQMAVANLSLENEGGRLDGHLESDFHKGYDALARLEFSDLRLDSLFQTEHPVTLHTAWDLKASASKDFSHIAAEGGVTQNYLTVEDRSTIMKDLFFDFNTTPDTTYACVTAGDLDLDFSTAGNLDRLSATLTQLLDTLSAQVADKTLNQEALRPLLPTASLVLSAGTDNPLHNYMSFQGTDIESINIKLASNPIDGVNGHARIGRIKIGALDIDTIHGTIHQDSTGIKLRSTIQNYRKTNPYRFVTQFNAGLLAKGLDVSLLFKDDKGRTGLDVGLNAETENGVARLSLFPHNPVIAYRNFTINPDNFVSLTRTGTLRANLHLLADDGTGLLVYSEPSDSTINDITLSISNLNLRELCQSLPYMPNMAGTLNGDVHVTENHGEEKSFSAMGSMEIQKFAYENAEIGNLGAELVYMPKDNGEHYADAFISYEGDEVGEASGIYNGETERFSGKVGLTDFPLQIANAFISETGFMMKGKTNGELAVEGTIDQPEMNGQFTFHDAHFYSPVYGVDFLMEERPLVFEDSRLAFDDYRLSSGKTALLVNGVTDVQDLSQIKLDLSLAGKNFALIDAPRQTSSLVFGKVNADFNGTVRGALDNLLIRGQLDILPTTDATYMLTNSPITVDDRLNTLVTFVDFSDSIATERPTETKEMRYDITLGLNIDEGAKFHCFLSPNGSSYVNLQGGGQLMARTTQAGDIRMTGRYTIQEGRMNYELSIIPLKTFTLEQGSYVEFTGDILNPTLSLKATEETKAIVSENNVQRSVRFNVGVDISRTLQDMGLAFTIDAPDDLGVQGQLMAMTEEGRNKSAVTLLATGMFMTDDMTNLNATSALNAFLQKEIQNVTGKALKSVDLSFGMENGTSSEGTLTTDYSFRFSKRFLNDRFIINIGGKLSSGQNATNTAESFIDNISIEYRLDNSGTRYVKALYDRNSRDPLEGNMTKTGASLVLRRKTDRLKDLFIFRRNKKE